MPDTPIRRALVSVSDKSGLAELGRFLAGRGVEILSTGGSARALAEAGVPVVEVADHTGFPEILDGRVKTLHPAVHGGLLARRDLAAHMAALEEHGIAPIDLLVVNLYPFAQTVAGGADRETCIENIDIGGPALIRGAAKNHAHVAVITDPAQYAELKAEMAARDGATSEALRRRLAARAFAQTAAYDAAIAAWMAARQEEENSEGLPEHLVLDLHRTAALRYGENPHQAAALYGGAAPRPGVASASQVQGKALSYNNLNDTDAAYECVAEVSEGADGPAAVVIVKHANPCGVAVAASLAEAYHRALACDPVSAFGGIVAVGSHPRRRDRAGHRRDLHRGGDRPGRRCRGPGHPGAQGEPAPAAGRRAAGPGGARPHHHGDRRRLPGAVARRRPGAPRGPARGHQAGAGRARARRPAVRLPGRQARQVQRHRLRHATAPRSASAPAR